MRVLCISEVHDVLGNVESMQKGGVVINCDDFGVL